MTQTSRSSQFESQAEPQTETPAEPQSDVIDGLIQDWEAQQGAYVRHRTNRFEVILDAIAYTNPAPARVIDLGGGLGSFSRLILERFPTARTVTVDYDPAMLELARHNLSEYRGRATVVEADLLASDSTDRWASAAPDCVVSSTALHWLPADGLAGLYGRLGALLPANALFFNADHLARAVPETFFRAVSAADDARQQQDAFSQGVPDWDTWWERLARLDGFPALLAERTRRFADRPVQTSLTPAWHIEALRAAGFGEAGTIWQHFDDYVVYGVR
ncbi:MAG: class I SAM-dependent methyltransferase [Bifidobacteriaceae bacterium]|jgi:trans-aconitate methyltransferase|nr:class I SAM-dependent methyltransferase [Bifidobacteriaceae bacterium]